MDSMETLDNISIDDLLQIGGGGFQGFGESSPAEPSTLQGAEPAVADLPQEERFINLSLICKILKTLKIF